MELLSPHRSIGYTIATPVYEGPLDLLLQLIEQAELDITTLALAQVTDQYLEHIREIEAQGEVSTEEVSSFLVIAAKLLQIKSETLLPRPPIREPGEEDIGDALARQLIEYKRYKELAGFLSSRQEAGYRTYPRLAPPPHFKGNLDLSNLTIEELVVAAKLVLLRQNPKMNLDTIVSFPFITIREKITLIANYLRLHRHGTFYQLLNKKPYRLDIVVTFLALLELVKRRLIQVQQEHLFGIIDIETSESWEEHVVIEPEFVE